MVLVFALVFEEMLNRKDGCGILTVWNKRWWIPSMPKICQEEPGDLQGFFRVYFKADFIEANSSYEEELQAFFFLPRFFPFDIGSPLSPKPPTAYNPFFCSEERLTLKMSNFLSYGDNLTFFNLFNTKFSRLTCPATWHQSFSPK